MYKNKKIVGVIAARGGSKRLPGKNVKLLGDKPLIAYSIISALKSKHLDRVIVSTDDKKIAKIAQKYGAEVPFLRPAKLATDTAKSFRALQHTVNFLERNENYKPDIIVLVQPTSPMVLSEDIDKTIEKLFETGANSCTTMCEISERPEWMYETEGDKAKLFLGNENQGIRSQDLPKLLRINGAVYATKRDFLMENNKVLDNNNLSVVIMPRERSVDIDEPIDFKMTEALLKSVDR